MTRINVLGFGVMGRQITALLQALSYDVFVWDHNLNEQKRAMYAKEVKKLEKSIVSAAARRGALSYAADIADLSCALTYDALVEDSTVKKAVIAQLGYSVAGGLLLTNSSSYAPREINPEAVGLHFFNPIYALKFAEFSGKRGQCSSAIGDLLARLSAAGFEIIETSDNRGYIGNYLLFQEIANALKLIDRCNYTTMTIDRILSHMGRSVSLFDIIDLVGVDVTRKIIANLKEIDPSIYYSRLLDRAIEHNVLGKKNRTSIRSVIDA